MVTTRIAAELYISQAGVVILVTRRRLGIANAYSLSDDHAYLSIAKFFTAMDA